MFKIIEKNGRNNSRGIKASAVSTDMQPSAFREMRPHGSRLGAAVLAHSMHEAVFEIYCWRAAG